MDAGVIAALIAASAAVVASLVALTGQYRLARLSSQHEAATRAEERLHDIGRVMSKFREPLIQASYDLQSRIYNIASQGLLEVYLLRGTDRERSYVLSNTLFLIGQCFAWNELIRREIQFLDLGDQEQTRQLSKLQDTISHLWLTDRWGATLRVFAGDQRAIGERMIEGSERGPECIGYARFLDVLEHEPKRFPWLDPLRQDLLGLAESSSPAHPRLTALQNALIDLLAFLDPSYARYPPERRHKLPVTTLA
jgi:hypothetical protein